MCSSQGICAQCAGCWAHVPCAAKQQSSLAAAGCVRTEAVRVSCAPGRRPPVVWEATKARPPGKAEGCMGRALYTRQGCGCGRSVRPSGVVIAQVGSVRDGLVASSGCPATQSDSTAKLRRHAHATYAPGNPPGRQCWFSCNGFVLHLQHPCARSLAALSGRVLPTGSPCLKLARSSQATHLAQSLTLRTSIPHANKELDAWPRLTPSIPDGHVGASAQLAAEPCGRCTSPPP